MKDGARQMAYDPALVDVGVAYDAAPLPLWERLGFRFGDKGTHTSRTIMLEELTSLFKACDENASPADYDTAILDWNCLHKRTLSTRRLSRQRLRELYGLDPGLVVFRVMRQLWYTDEKGRPLLALLTAMARDPLLRASALSILSMYEGEELARDKAADSLRESIGQRLNDSTLHKVVRNAASTWTQSGHLCGRVHKFRQTVEPTPSVTAYALLLGYLLGLRGGNLFTSVWARVLDRPRETLVALAVDARGLGLLDISYAGGIIHVSCERMLTESERRLVREQN